MYRTPVLALISMFFVSQLSFAQLSNEQMTVETMSEPGPNWFIAKTGNGGYIFDGVSGEMKGLVSLSRYTPAVTYSKSRREIYAAESYFSRGVRGERTDLVSVYDFENLSPVAEIIIPNHMARLSVRNHLALMNANKFLIIHNMNPGHSVSVVDIQDRKFVREISTPGCAVNLPVNENDFLQICGEGTLQMIRLNNNGEESDRIRSEVFFNVMEDAVFDRTARTKDGWILITHSGMVYEVTTNGNNINISDGWPVTTIDEDEWRPGGDEFISVNQRLGLMYVAMHVGGVDTHHESGTEIWVIDIKSQRRLHRIEIDGTVGSLMVTQEAEPKLIFADDTNNLNVYNAVSFKKERSIESPRAQMLEDF